MVGAWERQLETRPPVQGGGRVVAASLLLRVRPMRQTVTRRNGRARGGELAAPAGRQASRSTVFGLVCLTVAPAREMTGMERGARNRTVQGRKWCSIEPNSNAKTPILVARFATLIALSPTKRPSNRSDGLSFQGLAGAQLAETLRPLRASADATRSTSARATVRASAMHLLSTGARP